MLVIIAIIAPIIEETNLVCISVIPKPIIFIIGIEGAGNYRYNLI